MARRAIAACALASLALLACGTEAFVPGPDGGARLDAGSPSGDASADGAAPSLQCPKNLPGPALVPVGDAFCVDATEVTFGDYAQFLGAGASAPAQPPGCDGNTSYLPANGPGPVDPGKAPVTGIDWCDAYVYCAWAGKRLCGTVSGAALDAAHRADPASDAWYRACTHAGDRAYPYGATYTAGACWDSESASQPGTCPSPVGSKPGCEGGYAGVFDMVGNVREWTNDCDATTGGGDPCRSRGGSCIVSGALESCAYATAEARASSSNHLGVRCCYYPSP